MAKHSIGDRVKVRLPGGGTRYGQVVNISTVDHYFVKRTYYSIRFTGTEPPQSFEESDIVALPKDPEQICTCGSHKTQQPKHSRWCDITKLENSGY